MTRHLGDLALEFLDGCETDRPFCLQVSFKAGHCQDGDPWPFQPSVKHAELYRDAVVPRKPTATPAVFEALPEFLRESEARRRWYVRFANPALFQQSVKDYYRLLTGVDEVVGELMARLEEKGLANDTVVIFTSDNGFYLGDRGLAGKWFPHEESIRLPLVIHDPRLPASKRGVRRDELSLNIDIAPTILDYAGVAPPSGMQGSSLAPLVRGDRPAWRDEFLYEHMFSHARIPASEAVRGRRWKYVEYSVDPVHGELYDLESDPDELNNLAGDPKHADKVAEYASRLARWRSAAK